jgi:hypothetical protein
MSDAPIDKPYACMKNAECWVIVSRGAFGFRLGSYTTPDAGILPMARGEGQQATRRHQGRWWHHARQTCPDFQLSERGALMSDVEPNRDKRYHVCRDRTNRHNAVFRLVEGIPDPGRPQSP